MIERARESDEVLAKQIEYLASVLSSIEHCREEEEHDEEKEKLSITLRSEQGKLMPSVTSISIDIRDMNDITYKKRLLPSEQQI